MHHAHPPYGVQSATALRAVAAARHRRRSASCSLTWAIRSMGIRQQHGAALADVAPPACERRAPGHRVGITLRTSADRMVGIGVRVMPVIIASASPRLKQQPRPKRCCGPGLIFSSASGAQSRCNNRARWQLLGIEEVDHPRARELRCGCFVLAHRLPGSATPSARGADRARDSSRPTSTGMP